mmetsp:Transcript_249/g.317  ORF Transcript_249/g.317 Transcript_249/m.317 type:complete len:413 (+) Transcript_249:90-1328(+)
MDAMRPGVVDAIGAAHVDAEVIVYFGGEGVKSLPQDPNLTRPRVVHIPNWFDQGNEHVSEITKAQKCADFVLKTDDFSDVVVLYAPRWESVAKKCTDILQASDKFNQVIIGTNEEKEESFQICGLWIKGNEKTFRVQGVLFLGSSHMAAEISLRCAANTAVVLVDPETCQLIQNSPSRRLARRHHRLELASTAKRWGVVVADVGRLDKLTQVADACCDWIERNEQRCAYVLALGVPTSTKLAHFNELEAFVLIGADTTFLESLSSEFSAKPIITAAELRVALRMDTWLPEDRPFYSSDLKDLDTTSIYLPDDTPHFNLATAGRTVLEYDSASSDDDQRQDVLALRAPTTLALSEENDALGFLQRRQYRGLNPSVEGLEAQAAERGDFGIAATYVREEEDDDAITPVVVTSSW